MGKTTRLAITMGDPFGVGPEVIRAALEAHQREGHRGELTVYGAAELFDGLPVVDVPIRGERPEQPGPSAAGGLASLAALHRALEDLRAGKQDALVTAPIAKQSGWQAGQGMPSVKLWFPVGALTQMPSCRSFVNLASMAVWTGTAWA